MSRIDDRAMARASPRLPSTTGASRVLPAVARHGPSDLGYRIMGFDRGVNRRPERVLPAGIRLPGSAVARPLLAPANAHGRYGF